MHHERLDKTLRERLHQAYHRVRSDLLAERNAEGHWIGELSTSALSTATAVSALALVRQQLAPEKSTAPDSHRIRLQELMLGGIRWLAAHPNPDGGFGDTDKSHSNIATTMLVIAAFHLANQQHEHVELLHRAESYVREGGGIAGLRRRYGRDKTFAVPILTNAALAGLVPWKEISPLPFEFACLPQSWYRFAQLPVVSYAIPALVAIGQAKYLLDPPRNPLTKVIRAAAIATSLRVLRAIQPRSGGYLEAIPLTSFVVMSLAATDRVDHEVTREGVRFIEESVRPDGSWPIDTNLATWNTTLSLNALAHGGLDLAELGPSLLDWLLSCQNIVRHPFTGADPGGWGWSDLSGAVPDADDTPSAILALCAWHRSPGCDAASRQRIEVAVDRGVKWLLDLQNRDGGWPTFCRGWGKLPFDRSGADLTAHALRAIEAARKLTRIIDLRTESSAMDRRARQRTAANARGFRFLERSQRSDGSWVPLWFGNQDHVQEENPIYGTAKVLVAMHELGLDALPASRRGRHWLVASQNSDGSWGSSADSQSVSAEGETLGSVEETALAVDALGCHASTPDEVASWCKGLDWLIGSIETKRHLATAPIGFYFAKLWYYERLYPLEFTVSALGRAIGRVQSLDANQLE
ncbi:MAG: Sporulenol synthase [Planctomycetota bacterium]